MQVQGIIPASHPLLSRCLISASLNQNSTFILHSKLAQLSSFADSDPENENAGDNLPGVVKLNIKSVHSYSKLTSWLMILILTSPYKWMGFNVLCLQQPVTIMTLENKY